MPQPQPNLQSPPSASAIQTWLITQLAEQLNTEPEEIDIFAPLDSYGLDSVKAMAIISKGEDFLGFQPSLTLLWHYPTIETLSQRLAEEFEDSDTEVFEI